MLTPSADDDPGIAPVRVLIAAGDPLARAGLAALLDGATGCCVAGQVDSAAPDDNRAHALDQALDVYRPDVVLWDTGWDSDSATLPDLRDLPLPVVVLVPDADSAPAAWSAGAAGLLLRRAEVPRLEAALTGAARGLIVLDPALAASITHAAAPAPAADLTPREIEVLTLLAEGLVNRAIAARLGISEHTVKFHLNAILAKLGAQSRTEAVVQAIRLGLIAV